MHPQKTPKFIVVTGGVLSGLGKGIATASIGNLLSRQFNIIPVKCDGYLNVDPGTMNPVEHGEVFVLDDGTEVDMDFGHYERFLGVTCKGKWNLTMGKVFEKIRDKERRGDYLGKTVQMIPHVTNLIKEHFFEIANEENAEIVLIEIGGTVGDVENELYIEAARELKKDAGRENVLYVHLTYIPKPSGVDEQKSKPTQQSVNLLREKGIQPDIIIGRCAEFLTDKIKEKIATFCDVEASAVISGIDVDNIYKIPAIFEKQGILGIISKKLGITIEPHNEEWNRLANNIDPFGKDITIAICGKYTALKDSYASIAEALNHCSAHTGYKINFKWVETSETEEYNENEFKELLNGAHAVIVPGGFGSRGVEGKIKAIRYCRENKIPYLGICYGMQLAVVEFARNVCGLEKANTTEVDPSTLHPVICILPEKKNLQNMGGTLRLGACTAHLTPGSVMHRTYADSTNSERHRHRYEVNPEYHDILTKNGMVLCGMSPDRKLVEFIELPESAHPYFVGCQGHIELKSTLLKPAPLFLGLVKAAIELKDKK
ncbi:MAG: CTP synthase (glutamine hydrolyzing) [Candidatus Woesearchaeota archaeon]|nr:CTP synthase (glutamine hydrolyzing) [Candidatus Woesearchaeota archaeon]